MGPIFLVIVTNITNKFAWFQLSVVAISVRHIEELIQICFVIWLVLATRTIHQSSSVEMLSKYNANWISNLEYFKQGVNFSASYANT